MAIELEDTVKVAQLEGALVSGRPSYTSYANMLVALARPLYSMAEVSGDEGTHEDPVSAETVSNTGVYRRVVEGWQRIADLPEDWVVAVTQMLQTYGLGLFVADTAEGLAATDVGEYFAVDDGLTLVVYRHDIGGVATELTELVRKSALGSSAVDQGASLVNTTDDISVQEALDLKASKATGRGAPHANFASVLAIVAVLAVHGPGNVAAAQDLGIAWNDAFPPNSYSGSSLAANVSPDGSDADDGSNFAHAFQTLTHVNTDIAYGSVVELWPGRYTPAQLRYNHPYPLAGASGQARQFKAVFPGTVTIGYEGDDLSAATFTHAGSNLWTTVIASANDIGRLLRIDLEDEYGLPMPIPRYSSAAAVTAATYGWHFDPATNTLSIRIGDTDIDADFKDKLSAIYIDPATNGQILLYGSKSYWEGIIFEGCFPSVTSLAGQPQARGYFKDCEVRYSYSYGFESQGGVLVLQDCKAYRTNSDGANHNTIVGFTGLGLEINFRSLYAGDETSYPLQAHNPIAAGFWNKQHSSNHTAMVVRLGGFGTKCAGPILQDTNGGYTYTIGFQFGVSLAPEGSGVAYSVISQGQMWLDTMDVPAQAEGAIIADTVNGHVHLYDVIGDVELTNGGASSNFTPVPA